MSSAAFPQFQIAAPVSKLIGTNFSITVSVIESSAGNVDNTYRGTVEFTSSDPNATLPVNYTFNGGDGGVHIFDNIKITIQGRQVINVVDVNDSDILGVVSLNIFLNASGSGLVYKEELGDWSPESVSASIKDGRATWSYRVLGINSSDDLINSLTAIFGDTDFGLNAGCLNRTLPYSHPLFPFWYAKGIASIKGVGGGGVQAVIYDSITNVTADPISNYWGLYPEYQYTIEFGPFPYSIVDNGSIRSNVSSSNAYDDAGTLYTYGWSPEWLRYTNWIPTPKFDSISYQYGQMKFRTAVGFDPANGQVFTGFPKLFLPDQMIKFFWKSVPLRYITSPYSFLNRFAGRINQQKFYNWGAGTLLYLGYNPEVYTPPVPKATPINQAGISTSAYSVDKLLDLELQFLLTTRVSHDAPPQSSVSAGNGNFIVAGHNLLPWFGDRQFHYATTDDGLPPFTATQIPSWLSVPFELLFTDPDVTIVNTIANPYLQGSPPYNVAPYPTTPLVLP